MPEWLLVVAVLAIVSLAGFWWAPLLFALPLFVLALAAPAAQAWKSTTNLSVEDSQTFVGRFRARATVAFLHLLQPLARLRGRLKHGLTMWRRRGPHDMLWPLPRTLPICVTHWQPPEVRLAALDEALRATGAVVLHGNAHDSWDLEVRGGLFGSSRLLMAFEDSGSGTQLVRLRAWPYCAPLARGLLLLFVLLTVFVSVNGAFAAAAQFGALLTALAWRVARECGVTMNAVVDGAVSCGLLNQPRAAHARVRTPEEARTLQVEQEQV
jgi:hypothetical protein